MARGRKPLKPLRDQPDRDTLVLGNLRLVPWTLARYFRVALSCHGHHDREDLHAAGLVGLIRAAELWDPTKASSFTTYAVCWIRATVGRAIALSGTIRVPVHHTRQTILQRRLRTRSLHVALDDEGGCLADVLPDLASPPTNYDSRPAFPEALLDDALTPRQADVIRRRYWQGQGQTAVAEALGVTRQRAQQIEAAALEKLRRAVIALQIAA